MYQHVNHATMVTILEEARVPFLAKPFADDFATTGLLIAEVKVTYKGQLRLGDSPLQVTIWVNRLRAVDFTLGYEVRSVLADPDSKPAVIGETSVGGIRHRGAEAGAAGPAPPGVSAALPAVSSSGQERGLWLDDAVHREDLSDLRRSRVASRRLQRDPVEGTPWRAGGRLGRHRFRRAGQPRRRRSGSSGRPLRRGRRAGSCAARRWTARVTWIPDSRWTPRGAVRCHRTAGSSTSTTCPPARFSTSRSVGWHWPRSTAAAHGPPASLLDQEVVAVRSGDTEVGIPDAMCIRLDRNGIPAAVDKQGR